MIRFIVNTSTVKWTLEVTPQTLLIPEFKALLDADRQRGKPDGLADLLYVFGMEEQDKFLNPYAEVVPLQREPRVRQSAYGDEDAGPSPKRYPARWERVQHAVAAYRYYNETSESRLLETLNRSTDFVQEQLDRLMRDHAHSTDTKVVNELVKLMTQSKTILVNKRDSEKILKEGIEAAKKRGKAGVEASPLESGIINKLLERGRNNAASGITTQVDES